MPEKTNAARLERERDFHNNRFTTENRQNQQKFYTALTNCFEDYRDRVQTYARNSDVLEYGCAKGEQSTQLATAIPLRSLIGIDISDVAVAHANHVAQASGLKHLRFLTMNAEELSFPAGSFDLAFGSGIIHHLNTERAFSELSRVLRSGGKAVFVEPLGHNPMIQLYRSITPSARTPDEHPLKKSDFRLAGRHFAKMDICFYGLFSVASPFLGHKLGRVMLPALQGLDRTILRLPAIKWQAWFSVFSCHKD